MPSALCLLLSELWLLLAACRTEMSCCQAQATQDMFWPHLAAAGVGDCDFTVTYAYSMPGPTSKQLSGSYSMLCFLDSTASDCMDTVCDNMIMSSQGSVYHLEGDLVTDDPSLPQFQACWLKYPLPRMAGARPQPRCKRSSSNSSPGAKTPKGVPSHHGTRRLQAAQQGSGVYHVVDNADILSGPLTVRDPATGQTWNGWLQATFFMHSPATGGTGSGRVDPGCEPLALADELLTEAEAAGKFLVRPSEVNIRLFTGPATA